MEATFEHLDTVLLIVISGRLDTVSAPKFDENVASELVGQTTHILLDMSGVTYASSAGLRSILQMVKHTSEKGGRIGLFSVPPQIMEVVQISGLPSRLDLYPDRADALKHAF